MEIPTAAKTLLEHKGRDIWTIATQRMTIEPLNAYISGGYSE